ncbi:S-adenosyl-L-methionine-dependent methyltransferase [Apiospora phragmitis]|uniref:S-adenosyl-L-methionine-dependent methyltransferase n=1 Tax=Apiospora phragmitis TaxID=2905665 RepID=A0ABR1VH38_9PEZI
MAANASSHSSDKILQDLDSISADGFASDADRYKALLAAYHLVARLETPWDTVTRLCMTQPALGASLKVAKDLKLFEKWHERGGLAESTTDLAALVDCDPQLLARLLRHIASNHMLEEVSADVFRPSAFATSLLQPAYGEWINYLYDTSLPCSYKMPEYLQKTGYMEPADPRDGIHQYTKGYKGDVWQYHTDNPREGASFNRGLGGKMAHQASWVNIVPLTPLLDGADESQPLLVDVGGNIGHDLDKFRAVYPDKDALLYLQDTAAVIKSTKCPDTVNKMVHDFFQPQPIKGRVTFQPVIAYDTETILHDWPDASAHQILSSIRGALRPGYSRLLIHEHVLPDTGAPPHATSFDLLMMMFLSGKERSEGQWRILLGSAGLKVVRIWRSPLANQAVLEAELA